MDGSSLAMSALMDYVLCICFIMFEQLGTCLGCTRKVQEYVEKGDTALDEVSAGNGVNKGEKRTNHGVLGLELSG
jgi:hypothetical protein